MIYGKYLPRHICFVQSPVTIIVCFVFFIKLSYFRAFDKLEMIDIMAPAVGVDNTTTSDTNVVQKDGLDGDIPLAYYTAAGLLSSRVQRSSDGLPLLACRLACLSV